MNLEKVQAKTDIRSEAKFTSNSDHHKLISSDFMINWKLLHTRQTSEPTTHILHFRNMAQLPNMTNPTTKIVCIFLKYHYFVVLYRYPLHTTLSSTQSYPHTLKHTYLLANTYFFTQLSCTSILPTNFNLSIRVFFWRTSSRLVLQVVLQIFSSSHEGLLQKHSQFFDLFSKNNIYCRSQPESINWRSL